jgi:hypothetical protein
MKFCNSKTRVICMDCNETGVSASNWSQSAENHHNKEKVVMIHYIDWHTFPPISYYMMLRTNLTKRWLTSSCVSCVLRAVEMLCSLWLGTPGSRSIFCPARGELPGTTSEVALTASSSVTLSVSFKTDVSWFAVMESHNVHLPHFKWRVTNMGSTLLNYNIYPDDDPAL